MNRKKTIAISIYDAEKYQKDKNNGKKGAQGVIIRRIDVTNKTDDEIEEEIRSIKEKQKEFNKAYKLINKTRKKSKPIDIPKTIQKEIQVSPKDHIRDAFDEKTGNTFVLFGSSKSGKSTLMMNIYNKWFTEQKKILTTLFAMNPQLNLYNSGIGAKYLIKSDKFDNNCSEYIDWQRKMNKENENKFHFLNMFDDFIDVRYNKLMNNLLLTYRNSNMSAIVCLQYVKLLSKAARSNVNNVILLSLNTDEAITDALKSFLLGSIKRNRFVENEDCVAWYRDKTNEHNYIHINPLHQFIYFSKTDEIFKL